MKGITKMEKEIKELLNKLGIKINIKGYWFWITAIEYKAEHNDVSMSELYNEVAKMNNTTSSRVERALRHAYTSVKKDIEEFFDIKYKINNSSFLLLMLEELEKGKS